MTWQQIRRAARWALIVAAWPMLLSGAQQSGDSSQSEDKDAPRPKAKRVWTNEDLHGLKGGINVVGEPAKTKDAPETKDEPEPANGNEAPDAIDETCESDAWSAAVAISLQSQGVALERKFWQTKLFGDLCSSGMQADAVGRRITGDYTLDDGTRLHLAADVTKGVPKSEDLIAATDAGRPFIISWKHRPLVLTHVEYIARTYENTATIFVISKMQLTDPITGRALLFDVTERSQKEIDGSLQINVNKRQ